MKYKVLGLSIIAFIFLILFLLLGPKEGISPLLFKSETIDSIKIYTRGKELLISSQSDIGRITKVLQTAKRFDNIERININTGFYDLEFFMKNKKEITIRVMFNVYNGIIISANDFYYNGNNLDKVVTEIKTE